MTTSALPRKPILGILNLMPNKEATEQQWLRLIGPQAANFKVQFITTASYTSKRTDPAYLKQKYHAGLPQQLDARALSHHGSNPKASYSGILFLLGS